MKKHSISSRRKFLTGMGLAAGAAAFMPTMKSLVPFPKMKRNLLNAWSKPAFYRKSDDIVMKPVKALTRMRGSHLLPLEQRPF